MPTMSRANYIGDSLVGFAPRRFTAFHPKVYYHILPNKRTQEENETEEVALGKCIDHFSDLVYGHWLGQKGLKIDSMER